MRRRFEIGLPISFARRAFFFVCLFISVGLSSGCRKDDSSVLAEVGSYSIRRKAVEQRDQVARIYYPQLKDSVGLKQLMDAYLSAEILVRNGHAIDKDVLRKEAERIDQTTLIPDKLNQIKAIFGHDKEAYMQVFILPTYVERVIYFDFFLRDPTIQAASLQRAQAFIEAVGQSPSLFKETAEKTGQLVGTFTVSLEEGVVWERPERAGTREEKSDEQAAGLPAGVSGHLDQEMNRQRSEEGKRWIQDIVNNLKPGQVWPQVIDAGERWEVVRYVERERPNSKERPKEGTDKKAERKAGKKQEQGSTGSQSDRYRMQAAFFPKADFNTWFEAEKLKVPIQRNDEP